MSRDSNPLPRMAISDIAQCSYLLWPRLFRGVTPDRHAGETSLAVVLAGLHIPATRWIWICLARNPRTAAAHVPYAVLQLLPVFSPHQARWYSWSSHTTKKMKNMNNPLSNLQLDVWYKVLIVICTIVFLSTAGGLLPKLPTNSALLISLGGVFFCCGEWKNHPRYTILEEAMGQRFLGTGFKRKFSITGTILCLLGAYLIFKGIMPLL
ncbi:hypothetical protein [Enterobacter ludwigii]|uniref:hypothetical protein n=1 Tax=Enterobacter ludwigii TaxID=299767 RepID=UPI002FD346CA